MKCFYEGFHQQLFVARQRSVTSARLLHATRRAQSAVWTARPPSRVCVNPAGRGCAVRTVSSDTSFDILNVLLQLLNKDSHASSLTCIDLIQLKSDNFNLLKWLNWLMMWCDVLTGQTSMSVQIRNFLRDVTKNVTTSPAVSNACAKMATSSMAKSTAWVRCQFQFVQLNFTSLKLHQRYSLLYFLCVCING